MIKSFITFGASLPWIYPLAYELGKFGISVAITLGAFPLPHRRKVTWPYEDPDGRLLKEVWSYPPGFNGKLAFLFNRIVRSRVHTLADKLRQKTGEMPYVINPNPNFLPYLAGVNPANLVYLNYDDYSISFRGKGRSLMSQEELLVIRSGTILCSSAFQTKQLKNRFPSKKDHIFHFPHGVHKAFVNPTPDNLPEQPMVCIVGRVTSRYDWTLIHDVVKELPEVKFLFVGDMETPSHEGQRPTWQKKLIATLQKPNVIHLGGLKHAETPPYYWNSTVNWMPYKADLPFVKASCPLKISDGLASGRRVISSDVPECQLHPEWISIYHDAAEAVSMIRDAFKATAFNCEAQRAQSQIRYAESNTWSKRASQFISILERDLHHGEGALV